MTEDTSGAIQVGIEAMKRIIAADKAKIIMEKHLTM